MTNSTVYHEILKEINDFFAKIKHPDFNPDDYPYYEAELKRYRDLKNSFDTAREEGFAKGMAEGIAEGIIEGKAMAQIDFNTKLKIAQSLKSAGLNNDLIKQYTGLNDDELKQLDCDECHFPKNNDAV